MNLRRFRPAIALATLPALLLLAGCGRGNEAERAVKDMAGVEEGSETQTAGVTEKNYVVEEVKRIRDADTGKVVGEEKRTTEVTVQEQVEVERQTEVKAAAPTVETTGHVPEGLGNP